MSKYVIQLICHLILSSWLRHQMKISEHMSKTSVKILFTCIFLKQHMSSSMVWHIKYGVVQNKPIFIPLFPKSCLCVFSKVVGKWQRLIEKSLVIDKCRGSLLWLNPPLFLTKSNLALKEGRGEVHVWTTHTQDQHLCIWFQFILFTMVVVIYWWEQYEMILAIY